MHLNLPRSRKPFARLLDFKQAMNPDRNNRHRQIIGQQPDARLKRAQTAIFGIPPLRENQNAVAPIHRFPGIGKAFSETGQPRQREKVE
jgi:hypothetical protein